MTDKLTTDRPGVCQPFLLYDGAVRGRLVRLNGVADSILSRHNYPQAVTKLLGEAMAAATVLADGLKFDGSFTFQMQGNGPVHTVVTDITNDRALRGCAKFDDDALGQAISDIPDNTVSLQQLVGAGHMAFTVDQGPDMERYQGIIEMQGSSIGECIHQYFQQSEQLETAVKIVAGQSNKAGNDAGEGDWQAAALILQRMPAMSGRAQTEEDDDAWRTAVILLSSLTDIELLDSDLSEEAVLNRLFGTVGGRILDKSDLAIGCRCSRERSAKILASFPMDEVKSMAEDGVVSMTCEFCEVDFNFTESDLTQLEGKYQGGVL